jgi:hypothetical protein
MAMQQRTESKNWLGQPLHGGVKHIKSPAGSMRPGAEW